MSNQEKTSEAGAQPKRFTQAQIKPQGEAETLKKEQTPHEKREDYEKRESQEKPKMQ